MLSTDIWCYVYSIPPLLFQTCSLLPKSSVGWAPDLPSHCLFFSTSCSSLLTFVWSVGSSFSQVLSLGLVPGSYGQHMASTCLKSQPQSRSDTSLACFILSTNSIRVLVTWWLRPFSPCAL